MSHASTVNEMLKSPKSPVKDAISRVSPQSRKVTPSSSLVLLSLHDEGKNCGEKCRDPFRLLIIRNNTTIALLSATTKGT
jgi:hypothetical protein